jgi:hypothetical protein
MAKVVLDANVIVGLLDEYDSLSGRATSVARCRPVLRCSNAGFFNPSRSYAQPCRFTGPGDSLALPMRTTSGRAARFRNVSIKNRHRHELIHSPP